MFLDRLLEIFGMDGVSDKRKLTSAKAEAERLAVIEQGLETKRLQQLHDRYVGVGFLKRKVEASPEQEFDLGTARTNVVIDDRGGQVIFITQCTGMAYFRFDGVAEPTYTAKVGIMTVPFEKLYLTNTAQTGKKLTIIIGQDPTVGFIADAPTIELEKVPKEVTTPTYEYKVMTLVDTEYSQVVPDGTTKVYASTEDGTAFKISFATTKYVVIPLNQVYFREGIKLTGKTLYFQCGTAGKTLFMEFWK